MEEKDLSQIKDLNRKLTNCKYLIRGKNRIYEADDKGFEKYRMSTPIQFTTRSGGICWDYVVYEARWFKEHLPQIPTECYYHELVFDENTCPSHTFLIFNLEPYWYYFEASWKPEAGLYRFTSKQDCLSYILHRLEVTEMKKYKKRPVQRFFVRYDPLDRKYDGLTVWGFIQRMRKRSQLQRPTYHGARPVKESAESYTQILMNPEDQIERIFFVKDTYGLNNSLVKLKTLEGWSRGRSELLVFKGDSLFLGIKKNGKYKLPGGGWEPNEHHAVSAQREAEEEARLMVRNPIYVMTYLDVEDEPKKWVKEIIPQKYWWSSYFTEVYVGEYMGKYTGHIDKYDQDDLVNFGKFYPVKTVFPILSKHHQDAVITYLNGKGVKLRL